MMTISMSLTKAAVTLPGTSTLNDIGSALQKFAVPIGIIALVICAFGWAASKGTAPRAAEKWVGGAFAALAGTVLAAAAPVLIEWASELGSTVSA